MEPPVAPELVWGLLPRLLGLVYVVAFLSLARQVVPLVGRRGLSPLHRRLDALHAELPAPRRWLEQPTLLWFGRARLRRSDDLLALLPWVGVLGGVLAMIGGPVGWVGLFLGWACFLSLDVCALWLPWDTLLLEAGFLALFLPGTAALPELTATELPLPAVAFLFRWLVVRLMWGFAKLKFVGTERGDSLYLQGFLTWLPMPTKLAWLAQKAPAPVLRAGCAFMWTAEVVAPALCLVPGWPRLLGGGLLVALMLGIWATGNWGHFNPAYAALCVVMLDTASSLSDVWAPGELATTGAVVVTGVLAAHFALGLLLFPLNSWVTQAALQWNADRFTWRRPWLERLLCGLRMLNRLRLVSAYGVFPPNTSPPIKMVPRLEGRRGEDEPWTPIPWRVLVTGERSPPRLVAPHHPRLDHSAIYVGLGLDETDSIGGIMFEARPLGTSPYAEDSWLRRLAQRVLEGEPGIQRLLGEHPFRERPPTQVRVVQQALKPTSLAERRRSGRWWHSRTMYVLHGPVTSDPGLWERWPPPPEASHPELAHWRRRSPSLARLRAAARAADARATAAATRTDDVSARPTGWLRAALHADDAVSAEDVAGFWTVFVPLVSDPRRRDDWDALPRTVAALRSDLGVERLRVFERIHQRAVHLLEERLEPHVYGEAHPRWTVAHGFQFHAALSALVFDGEAAYEAAWRAPASALPRLANLDTAALLYPTAVFRWEMVRAVVLCLRSRTELSRAPDMPFGLGRYREFLLSLDVAPVWFPTCLKSDDGAWTVPAAPFEEPPGPEVHDPWPGRVGDARDADVQDTPDAAGRGNTTRPPRDDGPGSPQTVSGKGGFTRS